MAGQDYAAGGIAVTTSATRSLDDQQLVNAVRERWAEALPHDARIGAAYPQNVHVAPH